MLGSCIAAQKSAQGIANQFNVPVVQPLLREVFWLTLLLIGFMVLEWIATRQAGIRAANALLPRATAGREFLVGAALGWAMLLAVVLPLVLLRDLHPVFAPAGTNWALALLSLLTLAAGTLALEVAFRGYLLRRLTAAVGPVLATIVLSGLYALALNFDTDTATHLSVVVTFVLGVLFSLAYLRTHALWLGWGLHFAWAAAMGVLLGLPVSGVAAYSTLVTTYASGREALTGGDFGPEGSLLTLLAACGAMAVLYRATRDWAWEYTHPVLTPAGYAMDVAPPAAHTAMESTAQVAPLVQILGTTSTAVSTMPAIDEHLRRGQRAEGSLPGDETRSEEPRVE